MFTRTTKPAAETEPRHPHNVYGPPQAIWLLDIPSVTKQSDDESTLHVRGWIASPHQIESAELVGDRVAPLQLLQRPDVTAIYGLEAVGFDSSFPADEWSSSPAHIRFVANGEQGAIVIPTRDRFQPEQTTRELKHARLRGLLRCVNCERGSLLMSPPTDRGAKGAGPIIRTRTERSISCHRSFVISLTLSTRQTFPPICRTGSR